MAELITGMSTDASALTQGIWVDKAGTDNGPLPSNDLNSDAGMFQNQGNEDADDTLVSADDGAMGGQTGDAGSLGVGGGAPSWPNSPDAPMSSGSNPAKGPMSFPNAAGPGPMTI